MIKWAKHYWWLIAATAVVIAIGITVFVAFVVTQVTIGPVHGGSAQFEEACLKMHGELYESRQSGICYSESGKILLTTGVGGFAGFN